MDVPQAQGDTLGRDKERVTLTDNVLPLGGIDEVVEQGLVLIQVLLEVLLEVLSQGMPEELPAHESPGHGVHQAMPIPVHMHGDQALLTFVGPLDVFQGVVQIEEAPGAVLAVAHRVDVLGFDEESAVAQQSTVEELALVHIPEELGSPGLLVHPVAGQDGREQFAMVVGEAHHLHQLRVLLRGARDAQQGVPEQVVQHHVGVGDLLHAQQLLLLVPLPAFGAFDAHGARGREEEPGLALGVRAAPREDPPVPSLRGSRRRWRRLRSLRRRRRRWRRRRRRWRRLRHLSSRLSASQAPPYTLIAHRPAPSPAQAGRSEAQGASFFFFPFAFFPTSLSSFPLLLPKSKAFKRSSPQPWPLPRT